MSIEDDWDLAHRKRDRTRLTGSKPKVAWGPMGVADLIKPRANVLEWGVGIGDCALGMLEAGCKVWLLDISMVALEPFRDRAEAVLLNTQADQLPVDTIDVATSINTCQHIDTPDLRFQLEHVVRSLKIGGLLALQTVWNDRGNPANDGESFPPGAQLGGACWRTPDFINEMVKPWGGTAAVFHTQHVPNHKCHTAMLHIGRSE
jgi:cyclopropane fatty-acyl-phospholipid synthase-like methyltransferase